MQIEETNSAAHYFPLYALFLSLGLGDLITIELFNVTIHHMYQEVSKHQQCGGSNLSVPNKCLQYFMPLF